MLKFFNKTGKLEIRKQRRKLEKITQSLYIYKEEQSQYNIYKYKK